MTASDRFHDLLFEMSNEKRYEILQSLTVMAKRITDLTREMNITTTEARRHVSRLTKTGLIQRDVEGYYHITSYAKTSLLILQEIEFLSSNREYFNSHNALTIPTEFVKQIGKLGNSRLFSNTMDFVRYTQNLLKQSEKRVAIIVDQFPMSLLPTIVETIDRGIEIRIIESKDQVLEPDFNELTSEESKALTRTRITSLYERRILDRVPLQLFLSESIGALCFPLNNNQFDYTGFLCSEEKSLEWCNELYEHYWGYATAKIMENPEVIKRGHRRSVRDKISVHGVNDPQVDAQAVQDAVDNYNEVILHGRFNFGSSNILLSKSVIIRGEGREKNIPLTSISKRGWVFPFHQFTGIFEVDEDNLDITIDNLNFTDYNCSAIQARLNLSNSVKVINNRITVESGLGRGVSTGSFGDSFHGIQIARVKGSVLIEGNYLDLAHYFGVHRGSVSRGGLAEDPEYRPDLRNHEYFMGIGILVSGCRGKVEIKNNIVRNANGRGIALLSHRESAEVIVSDNIIESEVYGSYPWSSRESGSGIVVQTGIDQYNPNFNFCIEKNIIKLEKVNQSGIVALGPVNEGSSKLIGGVIRDNVIYLKNGYEGIHIRKCDDFDVSGNKISGEAYYGIRISGHRKFKDLNMGSFNNHVKSNDLQDLVIKAPDDYVSNHSDGKMFSKIEPRTAHIWLDRFSTKNKIHVSENKILIDEGEHNEIINIT